MKYSNEIQIEIDDVYACPGHCPGCVLSSIERKNLIPDMNFSLLEKSIVKLIDYTNTLHGLDKINLTYGIGDHFLMDNDYLAKTYHLGATLIEKTNLENQYNGIFYTVSMIGKYEVLNQKMEFLVDISKKKNIPIYFIAVLDPKHLYHKNFADIYKKNIIRAHELTGKVDLSINLSLEAIEQITPRELFEFASINHFDEVTINYTPTQDNLSYVYFDPKKLSAWLIEFDQLIANSNMGTSYRPVIQKTIHNMMCKTFDEIENDQPLIESIQENLHELVYKSIQIDHLGNIFPKYEAIGDIAHSPRIGVSAWGNIEDNSIIETIKNNLHKTIAFTQKQLSAKPCLYCDYKNMCANSGFHIYNHVLKNSSQYMQYIEENNCPHIAKTLFNYYMKELKTTH